ncbi:MAG: NAD(P)H-hydrate dehydratase [Chroococcidiopsidaceae cyanobacterium CP_BM_RX_35]|nr:NAD(P)H-hydrate dehydratase [Chroococcidiopsidaceae cyanobacterium CP_BM_RX_35]
MVIEGTDRMKQIAQVVVTANQMRDIEARIFAAGMPVASLMEKVGGVISHRLQTLYSYRDCPKIGILVGPGHNGGDALVVARELHFRGYDVLLYRPLAKSKEITAQHASYAESLGLPFYDSVEPLKGCDLLIDGLFGYGQERAIEHPIADAVDQINQWSQPVLSIDLPTGIHTDTGKVLGTAIRANHTFCIGLWKLGLLQEQALEFVGVTELIDIDLPIADVLAVIGKPTVQRITRESAIAHLPLPRPLSTYKYKMGSMLLVCGSHRYSGGAILSTLGAQASGVGMLYIAVPESLQMLVTSQSPESLILSCPETATGAIAELPKDNDDLSSFDVIACGPGLTKDAKPIVQQMLASDRPLVLDADGLNILAELGTIPTLSSRQAPTVLTPHAGEFKRLFPDAGDVENQRVEVVREAAQQTGAVVLLKGARTAIASPDGRVWINPESTPALARGGSGDVLTGLIGGLIAQAVFRKTPIESVVQSATWWHAHAGMLAADERTELGVDGLTLTQFLIPALKANW